MVSPQDWPDWSLQTAGGLRYIGSVPYAGGVIPVTFASMERALIIVPPSDLPIGNGSTVTVSSSAPVAVTLQAIAHRNDPMYAYVNPLMGSNWRVTLSPAVGGAGAWQLFADTTPSVLDLARIGPQLSENSFPVVPPADLPIGQVGQHTMANSLPVVLASDQSALAATLAQLPAALVGGRLDTNIGAWLGSTVPTVGQKAMASSLPVALASDQSSVPTTEARLPAALVGGRLDDNVGSWLGSTAPTVGAKAAASSIPFVPATDVAIGKTGVQAATASLSVVPAQDATTYRKPYDSQLFHVPAAAVQATVTFAATANRRWVIDFASWNLSNNAATAASLIAEILDGVTSIYQSRIGIPATANIETHHTIGPGAAFFGTLGAAMVVRFTAAGAATVVESVQAGAYLLPVGV